MQPKFLKMMLALALFLKMCEAAQDTTRQKITKVKKELTRILHRTVDLLEQGTECYEDQAKAEKLGQPLGTLDQKMKALDAELASLYLSRDKYSAVLKKLESEREREISKPNKVVVDPRSEHAQNFMPDISTCTGDRLQWLEARIRTLQDQTPGSAPSVIQPFVGGPIPKPQVIERHDSYGGEDDLKMQEPPADENVSSGARRRSRQVNKELQAYRKAAKEFIDPTGGMVIITAYDNIYAQVKSGSDVPAELELEEGRFYLIKSSIALGSVGGCQCVLFLDPGDTSNFVTVQNSQIDINTLEKRGRHD